MQIYGNPGLRRRRHTTRAKNRQRHYAWVERYLESRPKWIASQQIRALLEKQIIPQVVSIVSEKMSVTLKALQEARELKGKPTRSEHE